MRGHYLVFLVAIATCLRGGLSDDDIPTPEKRLISTFQIVRFPNDACTGSNSRNGTCYTSAECSDKGGTSSGSCADGFGVCCSFVITSCGQTSSENITYWDQTPTDVTTAPTSCTLKVCPLSENICQLRVDFKAFVITGPSTIQIPESTHQGSDIPYLGQIGKTETNWRTNCLHDSLSISGRSSANIPPTVCGTLDGQHMYVDSDTECNTFTIRFTAMPGPAPAVKVPDSRGLSALATRNWDITIYQYECGATWAAPMGCTQYHWGPIKGLVTSYNHAGGTHLANQDQKICIRRERSYCYACFAHDGTAANMQISGRVSNLSHHVFPGAACGWDCEVANFIGAVSNKCGSYDCVIIPGAFSIAVASTGIVATTNKANILSLATATYQVAAGPQIAGQSFGIGISGADAANAMNVMLEAEGKTGTATAASICTKHIPFMLQFKSDGWEGQGEAAEFGDASENTAYTGANVKANAGFKLNYELIACT